MQDNNIKKLWHTNRKCFIEEFSILQTINSECNYEHTYFEYNHKTQELERLSTCQIEEVKCSGKKDKNGKLIYEGDIIKDLCIDYICTVVWKKAEFALKSEYGSYIGFNTPEQEVIGNVYENPELLNEE